MWLARPRNGANLPGLINMETTDPENSGMTGEKLLGRLHWRYATKRFDPQRRIPPADWHTLEQVMVLTPSSFGLQPWKFLVIDDPAVRERLLAHSWGQRQVVEASHFVVLAVKRRVSTEDVDRYVERIQAVRRVPGGSLASYREVMVSCVVSGMSDVESHHWARLQTYIALGNLMTSAAVLGIDTCPMEGLVAGQYDEILGLPARGLATSVACALGYRAADDKYARIPKVRFPLEEMIEHL